MVSLQYADSALGRAVNFITHKAGWVQGMPTSYYNNGDWTWAGWMYVPAKTAGDLGARYVFTWNGVGPIIRIDWQAGTSKWRFVGAVTARGRPSSLPTNANWRRHLGGGVRLRAGLLAPYRLHFAGGRRRY